MHDTLAARIDGVRRFHQAPDSQLHGRCRCGRTINSPSDFWSHVAEEQANEARRYLIESMDDVEASSEDADSPVPDGQPR